MHRLTVAPSRTHFLDNGNPFFYLADTIWSAFTNIESDEWIAYLDIRRAQGFNALQINILPQWDRSTPDLGHRPFGLNSDGTFDFSRINPSYFEHAAEMLERAVERGFVPVLVMLWSNYVEGTFFDGLEGRCPIPAEQAESYTAYAATAFAPYHPVYLISGDTNFSERAATMYLKALETVKRIDPGALASLHLCGGAIDRPDPEPVKVPESLIDSPLLDFITYQSGHFFDFQKRAATYAEYFFRHGSSRPILNAEPCYEGWEHGTSRFGSAAVRQAVWMSLLCGASAGIAYGSQGLWQWYRKGSIFPPRLADGKPRLYSCLEPPEWMEAIKGPAAREAGFAKTLFTSLGLFGLAPLPLAAQESIAVRAGATANRDKIILYLPFSIEATLPVVAEEYEWLIFDLEERRWGVPRAETVHTDSATPETKVHGGFSSDALAVAIRKSNCR